MRSNMVRVTLAALVGVLFVVLSACFATEATDAPSREKAGSGNREVTFEAEVRDGKVITESDTLDVALGERVVLEVITDKADEVHVHGYDVHRALQGGVLTEVAFTADIPGEFDIELHDQHLSLVRLRVR